MWAPRVWSVTFPQGLFNKRWPPSFLHTHWFHKYFIYPNLAPTSGVTERMGRSFDDPSCRRMSCKTHAHSDTHTHCRPHCVMREVLLYWYQAVTGVNCNNREPQPIFKCALSKGLAVVDIKGAAERPCTVTKCTCFFQPAGGSVDDLLTYSVSNNRDDVQPSWV